MKNAEEIYSVKPTFEVKVTGEDIDDIMVCALEGGITYWRGKAEVVGDYLGEYASEQISRGGELMLHTDKGEYILCRDNLLKGIEKYIECAYKPHNIFDSAIDSAGGFEKYIFDCEMVDEVVANLIIQYAIFDEIIYHC